MIRSTFCLGLALLGLTSLCQTGLAQKETIKIAAEQLAKECATDPKAAEKKYKDKAVEVEGEVALVRKEKDVEVWDVWLKGFEQGKKNWKVIGFFLPSSPAQDKAKNAKKGQKAVITGTFKRVSETIGGVSIEGMSIETR